MIPVNSVSFSIQTDGCWTGMPALSIVLMLIPDAGKHDPESFHAISEWEYNPANEVSFDKMLAKKFHGPAFAYVGSTTLANLALSHGRYHVILGGPEPTSHDIEPLVAALIAGGCRVQIDTAGHTKADVPGAWVTLRARALSDWHCIHPDSIQRADEIMVSVRDAGDIRRARGMFGKSGHPVWLKPTPTAEAGVYRQCVDAASAYRQWRVVK